MTMQRARDLVRRVERVERQAGPCVIEPVGALRRCGVNPDLPDRFWGRSRRLQGLDQNCREKCAARQLRHALHHPKTSH